jgi:hypothetical protein
MCIATGDGPLRDKGTLVDPDSELEDLQSVSQHMLTTSRRIEALEEEKRQTDPAGERFRVISEEIEALADEMRAVSHAETSIAASLAGKEGLPTVEEADRDS